MTCFAQNRFFSFFNRYILHILNLNHRWHSVVVTFLNHCGECLSTNFSVISVATTYTHTQRERIIIVRSLFVTVNETHEPFMLSLLAMVIDRDVATNITTENMIVSKMQFIKGRFLYQFSCTDFFLLNIYKKKSKDLIC